MKALTRAVLAVGFLVLVAALVPVALVVWHGISARDQPTPVEVFAARQLRHLAIPRAARVATNPVPSGPEVLARARAHFADHCASCHGNDGRGQTAMGRNLYPKAPDMTRSGTQSLSDGEVFSIIKNGVRLTGMPAWGEDTPAGDRQTWELVHFIRHLPRLTSEELAEMGGLNPRGREEWEQEEAARRWLEGGGVAPPPPSHHKEH